jgi:hypothetical protein
MATWASAFPLTWIVLDDGPEARALVARPGCRQKKFPQNPLAPPGSPEAAAEVVEHLCKEDRPIVLAPCDAGYWGEGGPCCKCTFAVRHLTVVRTDLRQKVCCHLFSFVSTFSRSLTLTV